MIGFVLRGVNLPVGPCHPTQAGWGLPGRQEHATSGAARPPGSLSGSGRGTHWPILTRIQAGQLVVAPPPRLERATYSLAAEGAGWLGTRVRQHLSAHRLRAALPGRPMGFWSWGDCWVVGRRENGHARSSGRAMEKWKFCGEGIQDEENVCHHCGADPKSEHRVLV
jgi:hypothetical protein